MFSPLSSQWRKYLVLGLFAALPALAQSPAPTPDPLLNSAREAWQRRDKAALQRAAAQASALQHPLSAWMDYWQLAARLPEATVEEVESFYTRWRGSYVEDRLRNDWLLVVGERGDWRTFAADYPRFRMDDDRDLHCQALRAERALGGKALRGEETPFKDRALAAWLAQRDADSACHALARELLEAKVFGSAELTRKLQRSAEEGRGRAFRQTAELHKTGSKTLIAAHEQPERFLSRRGKSKGGSLPALETAIALVRLAAANPGAAAQQLRANENLPPSLRHWAWLQTARQALLRLQPEAADYLREALDLRETRRASADWSEDTHAAVLRIALRAGDWTLLAERVAAAPERLRADPSWRYWGAQAIYRSAAEGERGDTARQQARAELARLAAPLHFYGQLAADELGLRLALPAAPPPPSEEERSAAAAHPGLARALLLYAAGLRSEATREWNFSLRELADDDRRLLAAAQLACERAIWDRCIATSERTKTQIDLAQRYPTPFREQVLAQARAAGLDPADPYGLMRQESRFVSEARSAVGASGLMQVMPATARWTAKKLGIPYGREQLHDADLNLRLGMAYFRLVLDDFDGALPLATAAYNAGPGRPRRWREGGVLDAAAWAETIPFTETRDYVKKVLANATVYARLLGSPQATLRQRLGQQVGPRPATKPVNEELP